MSDLDTAAMREKYYSQAMHAIAGNFIPDITALCDALDALRSWADGAKVDIEGLTTERDQALAEVEGLTRVNSILETALVTCRTDLDAIAQRARRLEKRL